jgi:hypothetical protein
LHYFHTNSETAIHDMTGLMAAGLKCRRSDYFCERDRSYQGSDLAARFRSLKESCTISSITGNEIKGIFFAPAPLGKRLHDHQCNKPIIAGARLTAEAKSLNIALRIVAVTGKSEITVHKTGVIGSNSFGDACSAGMTVSESAMDQHLAAHRILRTWPAPL